MPSLFASFALTTDGGNPQQNVRIEFQHNLITKVTPDDSPQPGDTLLNDCLVTPGLINTHTHLELSLLQRDPTPPHSFVDWLQTISARQPRHDPNHAARVIAATQTGIDQSLKFGVTCVGDISQQSHLTRNVLANNPIRAVSFGEVLGRGGLQHLFEQTFARAAQTSPAPDRLTPDRLRPGLSPHAPYTVDATGYQRCVELADQLQQQLCTHLAETREERQFLLDHTGPFRELWEKLGMWQNVTPPGVSPIEFARRVGLFERHALFAHVNDITDGELDLLATSNASVVWCPRTHDYFGHPHRTGPHPWRLMLERGINVCVATDSVASAGDLDLLAELRLVRQQTGLPATALIPLVTTRAARALRQPRSGSIAPGFLADLSAFHVGPQPTPDAAIEALLARPTVVHGVWVDGVRAVSGS